MLHGFDLNIFVIRIATLLFAVTIHEVAHGWVALRLGDATAKWAGRLTLNPVKHLDPVGSVILPLVLALFSPIIFGYAKPVPVNFRNLNNYRRDSVLVSLAGVTANLLLALSCGLIAQLLLQLRFLWVSPLLQGFVADLSCFWRLVSLLTPSWRSLTVYRFPHWMDSRVLLMVLPARYASFFAQIEKFGMLILFFLLFTGTLNSVISLSLDFALQLFLGNEGMLMFSRLIRP